MLNAIACGICTFVAVADLEMGTHPWMTAVNFGLAAFNGVLALRLTK